MVSFWLGQLGRMEPAAQLEFNVECYSPELGRQLTQMAQSTLSKSRSLSLEEVDARALPIKLRDGIARMFAPCP
jgi:cardiolipin synthase A/B